MEPTDRSHNDACCTSVGSGSGVRQTLSELEFERGIWYAAQNNDSCRVESLLQKRTSPNAEDAAGYTALHYAARNGHESICRILISNGANVNAVTRCGRATALHRAATQCRVEIVKLLLKSGADVNIRDSDGLTALDRAIKSNCTEVCKLLTQESDLDITDMS